MTTPAGGVFPTDTRPQTSLPVAHRGRLAQRPGSARILRVLGDALPMAQGPGSAACGQPAVLATGALRGVAESCSQRLGELRSPDGFTRFCRTVESSSRLEGHRPATGEEGKGMGDPRKGF